MQGNKEQIVIERINTQDNLLSIASQTHSEETKNASSIEKSAAEKAYSNPNIGLLDESDISKEALSLYQREQDINYYKVFLNDISEEEATNDVIDLMQKGVINIDDEELADSMLKDLSLLNELF